jgi:hypothetical protein
MDHGFVKERQMRKRLTVLAFTIATLIALWAQPALAILRPGHS